MNADARRLFIFGTGAHARKVAHYAVLLGWRVAGFVDEAPQAVAPLPGLRVLPPEAMGAPGGVADAAFVAIGAPTVRRRLCDGLQELGWTLPVLVHPGAWVAPDAVLGAGSLVAAGAVVETGVLVGRGVIVDIGVLLDHDVQVGDFAHLRTGEVHGPRSVCPSAQ